MHYYSLSSFLKDPLPGQKVYAQPEQRIVDMCGMRTSNEKGGVVFTLSYVSFTEKLGSKPVMTPQLSAFLHSGHSLENVSDHCYDNSICKGAFKLLYSYKLDCVMVVHHEGNSQVLCNGA